MSTTDGWRDLVMAVIRRSYAPGAAFNLQNLYQRVKGSPEYEQRSEIEAPEATIRNVLNGLVKKGELERLSPGRYRYHH